MKILYLASGPTPGKPNSSIFIQRRLEQLEKQREVRNLAYDILSPVVEYKSFLKFILRLFKNYRFFDKYPGEYELNHIVYRYIVKKMGLGDFLLNYYNSYKIFEKKILKEVDFSEYDLIHAHFAFPNGIIAKDIHLKCGIPYVLSLHGTDIHTLPYKSEQLKQEIVESLENAFCCIFVSNFLKGKAIELGYSGKNAVVISNGYDPERFYYEKKKVAKEKMGFKEDHLIGFVGNLIDVKNVMLLPKIYKKIQDKNPNTAFVIVGEGHLKDKLKKVCRSEKLNVRFAGSLPQYEVADYMRAMDVMLLPSKNEGFGAVIIEARACGTYVIGSDRGGIPEAVGEDGLALSLEANFVETVSENICLKDLNEHIFYKIAENAKKYTWENIVKKEISAYKGDL